MCSHEVRTDSGEEVRKFRAHVDKWAYIVIVDYSVTMHGVARRQPRRKMLKFVAHVWRQLPTCPVGIVVFGCQIARPVTAGSDRKTCPSTLRGDLEGFGRGR